MAHQHKYSAVTPHLSRSRGSVQTIGGYPELGISCLVTLQMAVSNLKSDCITLQHALLDSKLLLNSKKTKAMLFAPKSASSSCLSIDTLDGVSVEFVDTYKYLGFWLDSNLNFKHHIEVLTKKLKFTLGLVFRLKGRVGKFEKPARDTLFVIFHGMLLTSR